MIIQCQTHYILAFVLLRSSCGLIFADAAVRLIEKDTGRPVSRAIVMLSINGETEIAVREFETDEDGLAPLTGIKKGVYRVRVEKPGHVDPADPEGKGRVMRVSDLDGSRLLIGVVRAAAVSGQVSGENGQSLSGMGVFAVRRAEREGTIRYGRTLTTAFTDDQGRYRLHSLPPGAYTVAVAPMGEVASSSQQGVVYYPGYSDASRAEFLDLAPGADLSSVDIRVTSQQPGGVAGTVVGIPKDWAGSRAAVALIPQSGVGLPVSQVLTDAAGRYQIENVPSGDYRVMAWGPLSDSGFENPPQRGPVHYASGTASVRGGEAAEIDLALAPAIRVESRWPASNSCVGVESLRIRLKNGWFDFWSFEGKRGRDGIAWDNLPAGTYHFEMPDLEDSCTFVGVQAAGPGPPSQAMAVASSMSVVAITAASSGEVTGRVHAKGAPVQNANVVLWADDERTISLEAVTDGYGLYKFTRLPPGRYVILVMKTSRPNEGEAPLLADPRQRRFVLGSGERTEIDLDLDEDN